MDWHRLQAWYDGEVPDDELTEAEVTYLQEAVFNAIAAKQALRLDVIVARGSAELQ